MRFVNSLVSSSSKGKRDQSDLLYTTTTTTTYSNTLSLPISTSSSFIGSNSKRMKTTMPHSITVSSISTHRSNSIGSSSDDIIANNDSIDDFLQRTSSSSHTWNKPLRDGSIASKADTDTITSDGGGTTAEGSIVAHLREKLLDFEQKNHSHYVKNNMVPPKDELEKPLRPKVKPSNKEKPGPTPLPKPSADALVRRMMEQSTNSSTQTPSVFRQRSTPVRLRIVPTRTDDVQATNEGYASVAKLSKWLADDPTSTKKVKQLRRGANIIAKSRKFDKVLANAEIEQIIPRNCVTRQKVLLQKAFSHDDGEDDAMYNHTDEDHNNMPTLSKSANAELTPDWMNLGSTASFTVSDKKKWLSNAFQTNCSSIEGGKTTTTDGIQQSSPYKQVAKARTEIISSSRNNDFGTLAKEKWRQRITPTKGSVVSSLASATSSVTATKPMTEISLQMNNLDGVKHQNVSSTTNNVTKSIVHNNNNSNDIDAGNGGTVDFHLARDMLIQRSKVNGNKVDIMTPFQRRKMKFQQLEKDATTRRQSSLQKPSWDSISNNGSGYYVKTMKEDIAPKKSLDDLP